MPLYEYGCDACGHTLEIQQKLADAPLTTCPACGKDGIQKLISATAFVLKGGGWYKDGYSSKAGDKPARTENDRGDRLEKAISDDKKKTASSGESASSSGTSEGSAGSGTPAAAPSAPASTGAGKPDKAA